MKLKSEKKHPPAITIDAKGLANHQLYRPLFSNWFFLVIPLLTLALAMVPWDFLYEETAYHGFVNTSSKLLSVISNIDSSPIEIKSFAKGLLAFVYPVIFFSTAFVLLHLLLKAKVQEHSPLLQLPSRTLFVYSLTIFSLGVLVIWGSINWTGVPPKGLFQLVLRDKFAFSFITTILMFSFLVFAVTFVGCFKHLVKKYNRG